MPRVIGLAACLIAGLLTSLAAQTNPSRFSAHAATAARGSSGDRHNGWHREKIPPDRYPIESSRSAETVRKFTTSMDATADQ